MRVGIEAIAFETPKFFVDMTELAIQRGIDPAKYTQGLGQIEMSVVSPCEDTVTLAASAGLRLFGNFSIDPESVALVIVGTETAVDHSKPVASHVHQILNLSKNCRVFETKHACYGATAGIAMATDWILSGRARGKKALVVASDVARYGANTPGEPTQGAGAVAMLISENPQLLEFETNFQGYFSTQVMDFWRPTYSKEAFADGHFSIQCYLDALENSAKMYKESAKDVRLDTRFAAALYHVPFVKMAQKAHQRLMEIAWGTKLDKESPRLAEFQKDYLKRVSPSLTLNARVGNIYTGSLYLSLFDFLENQSQNHEGKSISLFSYGSGCVSEFFSAIVQPGASEKIKLVSSGDVLGGRIRISVERYEQLLAACAESDYNDAKVSDPDRWNLSSSKVMYLGTKNHQRQYKIF